MAVLIGWLGAGKKHWQATYRTSPFGERWRWIECLGLEHEHLPVLLQAGARLVSLSPTPTDGA